MLSKTLSCVLYGLDAHLVEVEVDLSLGLPMFSIVGLPDLAVKESKDRVRAAIKNTGYPFPVKKITVNLAPADVKKEGSGFDLPMAVGVLAAEGIIKAETLRDFLMIGELSLDGSIKGIKGALSMAVAARGARVKGMLVPASNATEAAVVSGVDVFPMETLPQVVEFLNKRVSVEPRKVNLDGAFAQYSHYQQDFSDVQGQELAKRALEVSAAGGHNILMMGPPGSGKTMLAQRIPTILPPMDIEEAIETTKIHSIIGLLAERQGLVGTRPFRSPHHTISDAGLIGGGQIPKPGEVSLAHNGVLFLDELPEFKRNALEVLRQPLEEGKVTISRVNASLSYPAHFMLVAAMNPCQCGFFTDRTKECLCTPAQIQRYRSRVSGPLLDRIDIHIEVPTVPFKELAMDPLREDSKTIRERVSRARKMQVDRYKREGLHCNAQLNPKQLKKYCELDDDSQRLIEMAMHKLSLSARAYHRILKVSRTIADLDLRGRIGAQDVSEAIQYRTLDRKNIV